MNLHILLWLLYLNKLIVLLKFLARGIYYAGIILDIHYAANYAHIISSLEYVNPVYDWKFWTFQFSNYPLHYIRIRLE